MEIDISTESLPIFEALASDTRLKILKTLAKGDKNIKELSKELFMSSAIISRHIKKLEYSNLVKTSMVSGKYGSKKVCSLSIDQLYVTFPSKVFHDFSSYTQSIRLGHYTDYNIQPTCGLATKEKVIGIPDESKHFMNSERVDAEIVWFSQGFIEYKIPNLLKKNEKPLVLELSFEISSEFPGSNNNWPSDITFFVNDLEVGTWTVPGNFSDVRGRHTPNWWQNNNSQYGLLKTLRINSTQTNINGELISNNSIKDIDFSNTLISFRFEVKETALNIGGLTLYGMDFGNHKQNINCILYYS